MSIDASRQTVLLNMPKGSLPAFWQYFIGGKPGSFRVVQVQTGFVKSLVGFRQ
jgi:hypothetical protein